MVPANDSKNMLADELRSRAMGKTYKLGVFQYAVAAAIRNNMRAAKIRQADAANRLGWSQSRVSRLLKRGEPLSEMQQLAEAVGICVGVQAAYGLASYQVEKGGAE